MPLNINSSTNISYTVTNAVTGAVNDATVTVTITDSKGVPSADENWPVQLPFIANGEYGLIFDPFTSLNQGQQYTVKINVTGADGLIDYCECKAMAIVKNCNGGC